MRRARAPAGRGRRAAAPAPGRRAAARSPASRRRASSSPAHRPLREQHRHALGAEPARGEPQRLERRLVEPLQVVDHAHDRPLLGRQREQAEQRRADRQPRLRSGRLELQGTGERRRLRRAAAGRAGRAPAGTARPAPRTAAAASASSPRTRSTVMPSGALERGEQQGGLADPGLAAAATSACAAARAGGVQRAPDALQLHLTTDQHLPASVTRLPPRGHRRGCGGPLRADAVAPGAAAVAVAARGAAAARGDRRARRGSPRSASAASCCTRPGVREDARRDAATNRERAEQRLRADQAPRHGRAERAVRRCDRRSSTRSTAMSPPGSRGSARR